VFDFASSGLSENPAGAKGVCHGSRQTQVEDASTYNNLGSDKRAAGHCRLPPPFVSTRNAGPEDLPL